MTQEELSSLQKSAQQCCDLWIGILGMPQWSVTVTVNDDMDTVSLTEVTCRSDIGAANIEIVTGDVWTKLYPQYPYNMEIYIVSKLLYILFTSNRNKTLSSQKQLVLFNLARSLCLLRQRSDDLWQRVEQLEIKIEELEKTKTDEAEYVEPKEINAKTE